MIVWTTPCSLERAKEINCIQAKEISFRVNRKVIDYRNCVKKKIS